jgi:peptidoglycan/LPS O-acetylase OafA/YrhL
VAVCAFVIGSTYSHLTLHDDFANHATWRYFLFTAGAGSRAPDLPGVSFGPKIVEHAINGSLWTISVEVRLYLILAIVGLGPPAADRSPARRCSSLAASP